jgi:hypothetical protein
MICAAGSAVVMSCGSLQVPGLEGVTEKFAGSASGSSEGAGNSIKSMYSESASKGEVKDKGMSGDAHKKYAGKVMFTKYNVTVGSETNISFADTFYYKGFNADDVRFVAYFPRSFHNQAIKDGAQPSTGKSKMVFYFTVNGKKLPKKAEMEYNGEKFKEWTYFESGGYSLNMPNDTPYSTFFGAEVRPLLTEYENRIEMVISYVTQVGGKDWSPAKPMASGAFTLVIEKNMKGRLMPRAQMNPSRTLEAGIKQTLRKDDRQILRIVCPEPDWIIKTNPLTGVIIKRELRVAAAEKFGDGHCEVTFYYVSQQYTGAGYSSGVFYESVATDGYDIELKDVYK